MEGPGSPKHSGAPGLIHVSRVRTQLRGVSADNAFSGSGPSEPTDGHGGVANNNAANATNDNSAGVGSGCQGRHDHGFETGPKHLLAHVRSRRDKWPYRAAFTR